MPGRRAELREAGGEAAPLRIGPLRRHQHRAAPLAADREPLQDAAERQEDARPRRRSSRRTASRPTAIVDAPITIIVKTSSFLRPTRSPKWPKIAAPIGRATKPTKNVVNDSSVADERIGAREELLREHRRGGDAVQEEVVPLDGRADRRGDDGAELVDGGELGLGVTECGGVSHAGIVFALAGAAYS